MSLRHIEVFHAVYVHGSVSAAAKLLNVAQPSVSKVLRHAEDRIGFPLFHRAGGRLTPTEEAHALYREVDDIYLKISTLRQSVTNMAQGLNGRIALAVLPGFGLDVAPKAVAQFRLQHPSVTIDIQTIHHADIFRALHERSCDLAIGYDAPHHPRLACRQIGSGELVLLYRPGDIPEGSPRVGLDVLQNRDFISLAHSGPLGNLFNASVEAQNLQLREAVTISTMYIAAALVRQGVGMAVVDDFTARACVEPGLAYRPLDPPIPFGVYCVHFADRPLSRFVKPFLRTLCEVMQAGPSQESNPDI